MIRLTKLTDYGIVLLTHIANTGPQAVHNSRDLASETRIPLPMVSKILKVLGRDGILASRRGSKGGYSLARPADEISVAEIVHTLEGPIGITECCDVSASNCELQILCKVKPHLARINRTVLDTLQGVKLSEFAGTVEIPSLHDGMEREQGQDSSATPVSFDETEQPQTAAMSR